MSKLSMKESNKITDDFDLLKLMINDAKKQKDLYQPGPYWLEKTKKSVNEIKKFGLTDFRGVKSGVTTSYGDNAFVDIRGSYNYGIRKLVLKIFRDIYPFNRFFDSQVDLTFDYFQDKQKYKLLYLKKHERVNFLLSKHNLNFETTKGGCLSSGVFNGVNISFQYLQALDTLENINEKVNVSSKKTFFEIGGGFGINTHLMIELFKIKKIIYLDIAPNLYVGTQYLKSFYGEKVIDYSKNKDLKHIKFAESDELEIFCIAPQQIEKIKSKIDLFHNAHSFVEMPKNVVQNYATKVENLLSENNPTISLVSYSGFNLDSSLDPEILPSFFKKNSTKYMMPTLKPLTSEFHFIIE